MTIQASRFIGNVPENYDKHLGPRIFHAYADELVSRVVELQPDSVLELAAGTGIVSRRLRDALPDSCSIIASDLNEPMLEVAREKFAQGENMEFEVIDATNLPYQEEQFDVVTCQFGVMFFPDVARSYREVLRVLKPGGHYLFNVWGSWEKNPFAELAHNVMAGFFPDDPPGFYRVPFGYHDTNLIQSTLEESGFGRVTVTPMEIQSPIPSAKDFAHGMIFGNPAYEEIVNRGGDPETVCDAVANAINETLGDSMPLQAIFLDAVKNT